MSGEGVEVYVPVRLCADRDHERDVRALIQRIYPTAFVGFERIQAVVAYIDGTENSTLNSQVYAFLEVPC